MCDYTLSNINNIASHDKDVFWLYKARPNFSLSLPLNPYVLCAINMCSVDESMLFDNKLVSNAHVMV